MPEASSSSFRPVLQILHLLIVTRHEDKCSIEGANNEGLLLLKVFGYGPAFQECSRAQPAITATP